jgi:hypothetical protein
LSPPGPGRRRSVIGLAARSSRSLLSCRPGGAKVAATPVQTEGPPC